MLVKLKLTETRSLALLVTLESINNQLQRLTSYALAEVVVSSCSNSSNACDSSGSVGNVSSSLR